MAKRVFLGVGHGGADPGAVANGYKESNFNLDIALACKEALEYNGVEVAISRTTDVYKDLKAYIAECNAFNPDLAVDIHNNAGGGDGAEVYHAKYENDDDKLAQNILNEIVKIGQNSRGLKTKLASNGTDYFGFIRQVKCISVLVECAFIDNKNDVKIVDTLAERKTMGIAIAKGILATLGITYKEKVSTPTATVSTNGIKEGDIVSIVSGATYYGSSSKVPLWVRLKKWIVKEVSGNRAVIDKSSNGSNSINSPIDTKFLKVVKSASSAKTETAFTPYVVRVNISALNIRKGPGTNYAISGSIRDRGAYTIVAESSGKGAKKWGKLKSGVGWISLDYCKKV